MRSIDRQAGFTLIEVLVAMTLMAVISAAVLAAMRNTAAISQKAESHLTGLRQSRVIQEVMFGQIRGALPFAYIQHEGQQSATRLAFEGDQTHVRFISRDSFQDGPDGLPRWVEIQWTADQATHAGQLSEEERRILPPDNVPDSTVGLHQDLLKADNCLFDFLKLDAATQLLTWTPSWSSLTNTTLPNAFRLTCTAGSKRIRTVIPLDYSESSVSGLVLQ